jgi:hypothetical protein
VFKFSAEDGAIYVVATEDIPPDTEIFVFYRQTSFWAMVDLERKQAWAAMEPEQLAIVKAAYAVSKAEAKAAAVVKSALKKQAVKVWKTTNAAVKKAAKEAAEAVAVEAEQM